MIRIFFMLLGVGIELGVLGIKISIKLATYLAKFIWWFLKLGAGALNYGLNKLAKLLMCFRNYLQQKV